MADEAVDNPINSLIPPSAPVEPTVGVLHRLSRVVRRLDGRTSFMCQADTRIAKESSPQSLKNSCHCKAHVFTRIGFWQSPPPLAVDTCDFAKHLSNYTAVLPPSAVVDFTVPQLDSPCWLRAEEAKQELLKAADYIDVACDALVVRLGKFHDGEQLLHFFLMYWLSSRTKG